MITLKAVNFDMDDMDMRTQYLVCVPFYPFGHSDNFFALRSLEQHVRYVNSNPKFSPKNAYEITLTQTEYVNFYGETESCILGKVSLKDKQNDQ